ncbi:MAG: hypothetical protein ABEJ08_01975 [Halobacteriaceae archaeon]
MDSRVVVGAVLLVVLFGGATAVVDADGDGLSSASELGGTDPFSADTDGDGLDDGRERDLGTDPTAADTDGDGLNDGRERDRGTNATAADTDDDGFEDGPEIDRGTNATVPDTDGDGLQDGRETQLGTDPTAADGDGDGLQDDREVDLDTEPGVADTDGDGLDDGEEVVRGSDPTAVDTDGDTIQDGRELDIGTDPTAADTDDDGLDDARERDLGTDPTVADTDGDRLNDGQERDRGTNATVTDTDGDGLQDGIEVFFRPVTDPTDPDTDGDGLDDGRERDLETRATNGDTDGDGLEDGRELAMRTSPTRADTDGDGADDSIELDEDTNPVSADPDGDGLNGREEATLGTVPTQADSDGDGIDDDRELDIGTDPIETDTDGDGIGDGVERNPPAVLPGADPLRKNIYIEVDRMPGERLPRDEAQRVVSLFADAPVENPDGSTGIEVHIVYDEEIPAAEVVHLNEHDGEYNDADDLRDEHFDRAGKGYHYAVMVSDAKLDGEDVSGAAEPTVMLVESSDLAFVTGSLFMHELGHSLGLLPGTYEGIDSTTVPFDTYHSRMNYNSPSTFYGYSADNKSGRGFDDWEYIEDEMATPRATALEPVSPNRTANGTADGTINGTDGGAATTPQTGTADGATRRQTGAAAATRTIVANYRFALTPETPGEVAVRLRFDLPDDVTSFSAALPEGTTVRSTTGFEQTGDGSFAWDGDTAAPSITFDWSVGAEAVDSDASESVDTGSWALLTRPDVDTRWRYVNAPLDFRVEMAAEGEGIAAGRITYLGPHTVERVATPDQTIRIVKPAALDGVDPLVPDVLEHAARGLDIGARSPQVTAFVVPETVQFPGYSGVEYRHAFWIRAGERVAVADNLWVHEYVHARQDYRPSEAMEWIDEGAADYYAALVTLRAGYISFERFHNFVGFAYWGDAVLTERDEYPTPTVEYSKGRVVVAALDVRIRRATDGERTFAAVYRRMNRHQGKLTYRDFRRIVVDVGNASLGPWLDEHVDGPGLPSVPSDPTVWGLEPTTTSPTTATTTRSTTTDRSGPTTTDGVGLTTTGPTTTDRDATTGSTEAGSGADGETTTTPGAGFAVPGALLAVAALTWLLGRE